MNRREQEDNGGGHVLFLTLPGERTGETATGQTLLESFGLCVYLLVARLCTGGDTTAGPTG